MVNFTLLHHYPIDSIVLFCTAESERAPSERTSKYLKQPRTLSLAIVPGEHICSIALAIEQKTPPPTAQNAGDNNDPSHHTDTV